MTYIAYRWKMKQVWGRMRYKDEVPQNLQGNLFWRRLRIKTSKQTGPKSQSSAWRKGSRTCKPTEAKSTWRQEKQWNSLWWKLWTCGSSPLPPGSIQKMLKLQWHGCTGVIVSQPGVSPQHTHNLQMLRSIFIIGQQRKDFGQKSL